VVCSLKVDARATTFGIYFIRYLLPKFKVCCLAVWFRVRACISDIWTCLGASGLIFWVPAVLCWHLNLYVCFWDCIWESGFLFSISGLVFQVLGLDLGYLDLHRM
jgi:hypothetical protein